MERIYLLLISTLMIASVFGQSLSLGEDTVYTSGSAELYEIVAHGTIYNNTSSPVDVKWIRITENLTSGWEGTAICDGNDCYYPNVSTSPIPFSIPANGESLFDVHFRPSDISGNGTVQLIAWVVGDSANSVVIGTYKATATEPVGLATPQTNERISIYPNPAKDYILIRNLPNNEISTVEVYNIFGRRMLSFSQPANSIDSVQRFDINTLAKGIYMIRVFDDAMNVIYTESLSKE